MQQAKRRRGARSTAAIALIGLVAGSMALIPWSATATTEPPETAVTTSGQALAVDITTPASPARVETPGIVEISGTATVGAAQSTPLNAAFVVDISGSTGGTTAYDCNRNGITDAGDDFNGSGGGYGQLVDCAIAGVLAINGGLVGRGNTEAMVVGFAERSAVADMQSVAGDQVFTPAGNDSEGAVPGDVETVARSLRPNVGSASIDRYTARASLGSVGRYRPAISALVDAMATQPATEERVAFFIADGPPPGDDSLPINDLVAAKIKVNTFAVGLDANCAAGGALASIASSTGGKCTWVASPAAFTTMIAAAATIAAVEYSIDGGPFAPVTTFAPATGSFTLQLPVVAGAQTIRVRARAADGTLAQSILEVHGIDAPDVTSQTLATAEGTPLAISGGVVDGDNVDGELSFAWTPNDGHLSDSTSEDPTFVAHDNGVFSYDLTATDPDSLTGTGTKQITVTNVAPTIDAVSAPSPANEGTEVVFSADFSDPGSGDSHTVRFGWGDGSPDTIVVVDERAVSHTAQATHSYAVGTADPTLTVTVTDDDGDTDTVQQVVNINHGPSAALDRVAYSVVEGGVVSVASDFADVDGDGLDASVSIGGATAAAGPVASGGSLGADVGPAATADERTIPVVARVSDTYGLVGSDTATITVLNADPVVATFAAPTETLPDVAIDVTGTFTDAGVDDTHTVTVDWGDGGIAEPGAASTTNGAGTFSATHTYATFGTYTATARLCDADGGCTERGFTIAVGTPPTADAGDDFTLVEGTTSGLVGQALDVDAADGEQLTYSWSPDDGSLVNTDTLTPTFFAIDEGTHTYTLEVCDSRGVCGVDSVTITVQNAPPSALTLRANEDRFNNLVHLDAAWSDAGVADTFSLRIDWGDGSAVESTPFGAGVRSAVRSHAYEIAARYTATAWITDDAGGETARTLTFDVLRNRVPVASAGGPYQVDEGQSLPISGSASDPDGDPLTLEWIDPARFSAGQGTTTPTFGPADGSAAGTEHQITLVATDPFGAQTAAGAVVTVRNVAPTITDVTGPVAPAPIGTTTAVDVSFTDPSPTDGHTLDLDWDDGSITTVTAAAGARRATATHVYAAPGVYTVTATVRDTDGAVSNTSMFEYVVIYDPSGGFVTGAGSIASPAGSYSRDLLANGKATFGVASRYAKGSSVPSGETEFQLKTAGLEFKSTANEYLVISGAKATYRGVGNLNGASGFRFQVTVVDGAKTGGSDRFRIKIWNESEGVVYDNERTSADGADPVTSISSGSIVIHKA